MFSRFSSIYAARSLVRVAALLTVFLLAAGGCEREARRFRQPAAVAQTPPDSRVTQLETESKVGRRERVGPYDSNAFDVAQGKRLYLWFNCANCHGPNGGGGMGPPLMDDKWLYGFLPQDVFASIVEGRPNGMPSFKGRIAEQQVWQLVAYIRSMSGQIPYDALPSRADTLHTGEAELQRDALTPKPARENPANKP